MSHVLSRRADAALRKQAIRSHAARLTDDGWLLGVDLSSITQSDLELIGMAKASGDPAKRKSHKERMHESAGAAFDQFAEHRSEELLTVTEERNLNSTLPKLRKLAEQMGVIDTPLGEWSRDQIMQFLTMAIRCANPILSPTDALCLREFDDEIPFGEPRKPEFQLEG